MAWLVAMAALVACGVVYQKVGASRDRRRFPPPGDMIDVGGYRLHATCLGAGHPAVLLESGIAASSLSWANVQPAVASFTRVCAYDRAGLAWSEAPSAPMTIARILDDLATVLGRVSGGEPAVLVGHSFGGLLVRAFATRHPSRVAGLVLVDPPTEWLSMTRERERLLRGARRLSNVGALLAHLGVVRVALDLLSGGRPGAPRRFVRIFGPTAARTLERLVGEVGKLPPAVHPVVQALWCQPKCFRAMADYLQALATEGPSLASAAPPSGIPVIVISSARQPADVIEAQRSLASASARSRHVTAGGSGHWVPFDEPALIVEAVRELVTPAGTELGFT